MHLRFVPSESTLDYLRAVRSYVDAHGRPVALYSDKHTVFRVAGAGRDGTTQLGRALAELNVDLICANSSQAKGRVERAHKTLQDRLVKELRLAGNAHGRGGEPSQAYVHGRRQRPHQQGTAPVRGAAPASADGL